ncbi:VOC family protein [Aggregicoccus sp. 17bor-14]|uniref:VOC family protein n=1 Tax=Myxococcaceae TaxID=31 RepID=UPI00129C41C5|nr:MULTISPECIES: VOC family protein [Myxococcaceae]MBF5045095.1 VOC family protein [Simulacricoccus sp. 17bor-14]MRI90837.1 VOC family protein [Aggregicoccus sp. 17bor-14]
MAMQKQLPGKFVWFELVTPDAKRAQAFYAQLLGWGVQPHPMAGGTYDMITAGEAMIGGYLPPGRGQPPRWVACVSVEDVDAAAKEAVARGGRVLEGPLDIPEVGRLARIADPEGAELTLFRSLGGDPPDGWAHHGHWLWNELHTHDPKRALAFYAAVAGFSSKALDMGEAGAYHVLHRNGADRGGVTNHLPGEAPAHWLPYVSVDDADAALERARQLGGKVCMEATDIPGVGRFGILTDPTGASLAVMKPAPMPPPRA